MADSDRHVFTEETTMRKRKGFHSLILAVLSGAVVCVLFSSCSKSSGSKSSSSVPTTGLELWLKADEISGLTDGASVSAWKDSSSVGNNGTQSDPDSQPTYHTNVVNGYPVVRFGDDGESWMELPAASVVDVEASVAEFDVFAVVKRATDSSYQSLIAFGQNGDELFLGFHHGDDSMVSYMASYFSNLSGTNEYLGVVEVSEEAFALFQYTLSGTQLIYRMNGVAEAEQTLTGSLIMSDNTARLIGSDDDGEPLIGDVAELLFYTQKLSDTSRTQVNCYLSKKYALAIPGC
jgi:hypothetical protein